MVDKHVLRRVLAPADKHYSVWCSSDGRLDPPGGSVPSSTRTYEMVYGVVVTTCSEPISRLGTRKLTHWLLPAAVESKVTAFCENGGRQDRVNKFQPWLKLPGSCADYS